MIHLKCWLLFISTYIIGGNIELVSCRDIDTNVNNDLYDYSNTLLRFKREEPVNISKTATTPASELPTIPSSSVSTPTVSTTVRAPSDPTVLTTRKPKPTIISEPIAMNTTDTNKTSQAVSIDDEINIDTIDKVDVETNRTLIEHNINEFKEEYFIYYNSTVIVDESATKKYWSDLGNLNVSNLLSKSHRRAMTVHLSFDFPFYGYPVRNITVATGGFLYTGDYVHSWLAATQYIAPLMANFDTSISNDALVKYVDNGTAFTVVWEKVSLQDRSDIKPFTFGTTLLDNGNIIFAYHSVPILIESIHDDQHPVKVGLSDAYTIDKTIYFSRRKTIYEYHRVNFGSQDIKNWTLITLTAQPTCLSAVNCESCLSSTIMLKCTWCPVLNRCSTGMDRNRQDWLHKGCEKTQIVDIHHCPVPGSTLQPTTNGQNSNKADIPKAINSSTSAYHVTEEYTSNLIQNSSSTQSVGVILGILLPIVLMLSFICWTIYAYRNPLTRSGQLLIQYRPTAWTLRRGEARYTAATIHM